MTTPGTHPTADAPEPGPATEPGAPAAEAEGAQPPDARLDTADDGPEGPEPAGRVANLASGLVALAIGVAGAVLSASLGLGTLEQPGTGLWPFAICVAMATLAAAQLLMGRHGGEGEKFSRHSWTALVGLVTLVVLVVLLPVIGFEIPALVLSIVWMRFLGGETWRSTIVCSVGLVAALYAIFVGALGTAVPHLF